MADSGYEAVCEWLRPEIARAIDRSLPPKLRGWYTADEAEAHGGNFIEVTRLDSAEPRFIPGRSL